jgi:hypothetical protein
MPEDDATYIVQITDTFRVRDADSEEEAEQIVLDRLGEDGWEARNADVIDKE